MHIEEILAKLNIFLLLIKDDELLEKYKEIWQKVSNSIKNGFDSEPVYNEINLKPKIKSYKKKINPNFHSDKIPKEGSQCVCLSVLLNASVYGAGKHYYPQVFLEKHKYVITEIKMLKYIADDIEMSSDDSDERF